VTEVFTDGMLDHWFHPPIEMGKLVALQTEPDPEPLPPVAIDEEASYQQWIGLLYACAVFRGVVSHPPPRA
jgi:hypothetical protein